MTHKEISEFNSVPGNLNPGLGNRGGPLYVWVSVGGRGS